MNQRELIATFYCVVGIAALLLVLLAAYAELFLALVCFLVFLLVFAGLQARKKSIAQSQERLKRKEEERIREEKKKQALFESLQRDSDYLESLKRARGETRY